MIYEILKRLHNLKMFSEVKRRCTGITGSLFSITTIKSSQVFRVLSFLTISFFVLPALVVFAHGNSYSLETTVDGYLVDVGVSTPTPVVDELVRFDFTTRPEVTGSTTGEVFTDVWVSITQDKKVFFSGNVHKPIFGPTGINLTFADPGEYTVSARFQNEGDRVVEASFPLAIIKSNDKQFPYEYGLVGLVGLLLGIIGTGLFVRYRTKPRV